ncbi:uncharacterized protein BP5553_04145 [Venustampulla echinocandica]|uniref:DUF202 domain-containing protein n=1 Tax=Venustampulla echinocandica TaxID=2656787 RepID=A0A370TW99_9HELO|nr:uncharacterized protein BP5553_04145 [Venustampulla echinocandica]RDL39805.1 hypothetical protein BP5553_04145 [Venustampulla echinocandica]
MPRAGDIEEAISPHGNSRSREPSSHSQRRRQPPPSSCLPPFFKSPQYGSQPPHNAQPAATDIEPADERPYMILLGMKVPFGWWAVPLVDNNHSDARDHCANERTFLSYLRLSMYMCIVAVAIVVSFHLKVQPTDLELRMARPLGIAFWCLSVVCLVMGMGNYMKTVKKYSQRVAIVQSGWKTQSVCTPHMIPPSFPFPPFYLD